MIVRLCPAMCPSPKGSGRSQPHPARLLGESIQSPAMLRGLVGPLCTPLDRLPMPTPEGASSARRLQGNAQHPRFGRAGQVEHSRRKRRCESGIAPFCPARIKQDRGGDPAKVGLRDARWRSKPLTGADNFVTFLEMAPSLASNASKSLENFFRPHAISRATTVSYPPMCVSPSWLSMPV